MSKSLEQEYKKLAEQDIPDLWNRIEAGLEAKVPAAEPVSASADKQTGNKRVKSFHRKHIWRYAGIAAAALAVVTIIPAVFGQFLFGGSKSFESASDSAAPQRMGSQMTAEENTAGYANGNTGNSKTESAAEYESEEAAEVLENKDAGVLEETLSQASEDGNAALEDTEKNQEYGTFQYQITGEVMSVSEMENEDTGLPESVYRISVKSVDGSDDTSFQDSVIRVRQGEVTEALVKGVYYVLLIEAREPWVSAVHPFVLVEVIEAVE